MAETNAIVPRKRTPSDIRDQIIDLFKGRAYSSLSALVLHGCLPLACQPRPSSSCCCCSRGPRGKTLTLALTRDLVVSVESHVDAELQGRARPSTHLETVCAEPAPVLIPCLSLSRSLLTWVLSNRVARAFALGYLTTTLPKLISLLKTLRRRDISTAEKLQRVRTSSDTFSKYINRLLTRHRS